MITIDLNCDLGEWKDTFGAEKDEQIMPFISSCNIACGGHIGSSTSIRKTIQLAQRYEVAIGVHPSYPDREQFGRVVMPMASSELEKALIKQLSDFLKYVEEEQATVHHVKPHGALYNQSVADEEVSILILNAMEACGLKVPIYTLQGSVLAKKAVEREFLVINEIFADRAYEDDGTLRNRNLPHAVLHQKKEVLQHLHQMVIDQTILTSSGKTIPVKAQTICLHSDTTGSIELAGIIHEYLTQHGVHIAPV
jgi:UPF0271 protein